MGYQPPTDPSLGYKPPAPPREYQPPSWLPGAGWLRKVSNSFDDSFTGHWIDPATAKVGELLRHVGISNATPDVDTLRAQTAQDRKDTPVGSALADIAAYGTGVGKLGVGGAVTEGAAKVIPGMASRMVGQGAENALWSGVSSLGSGNSYSDAAKDAGVGFLIGNVTGLLPGGRGNPGVTPGSKELEATASKAYDPLKSRVYPPVYPADAMTRGRLSIDKGLESKMSGELADRISRIDKIIGSGGNVTADDIASFQAAMRDASRTPADGVIAQRYIDSLNKGVGSKTAGEIAGANKASNIAKTSGEIEGWIDDPKAAPKLIRSALDKNPQFYKSQPGLYDRLKGVADSGDPSFGRKIFNHVLSSAATGAAGAGMDYALGSDPVSGGVHGAITGLLFPHIASRLKAGPITRDLRAAAHLNATGQAFPPGAFASKWLRMPSEAVRTMGGALSVSNPADDN